MNHGQGYAARVLRLLAGGQQLTQTQVMRKLGLRRTTVFNVVGRLEAAGLVTRGRLAGQRKGRPSLEWGLTANAGRFLIAYWGSEHSYYTWVSFNGAIGEPERQEPCGSVETAVAQLAAVVAAAPALPPLLGIQVVLPGVVDGEEGEVVLSNEWRLRQYPLVQSLRRHCRLDEHVPVRIENDAHAAAFGESIDGVCTQTRRYLTLFVTPGRGSPVPLPLALGSGLVWDGRLMKGRHGAMGELDRDFYPWLRRPQPDHTGPARLSELPAGELRDFAVGLGTRFAHLVNYLAPEAVVIQSVEEPVPPDFVAEFQQALARNLIAGIPLDCEVRVAHVGPVRLLQGGAACLRQAFFAAGGPVEQLALAMA